ncbi:MAG TPA: hypothetical protein VNU49_07390 [Opitutaceae bacterium]|nr:hypothetical protein [Opitutaceae bacterium]
MRQEDIKNFAKRLTEDELLREIPNSEECRNRIPVVIRVANGKEIWEETVDRIIVDSKQLMLVWNWKKTLGFEEDCPGESILLSYDAKQLVEVQPGRFQLASPIIFRKEKPNR